jgi:hypothetical protein
VLWQVRRVRCGAAVEPVPPLSPLQQGPPEPRLYTVLKSTVQLIQRLYILYTYKHICTYVLYIFCEYVQVYVHMKLTCLFLLLLSLIYVPSLYSTAKHSSSNLLSFLLLRDAGQSFQK